MMFGKKIVAVAWLLGYGLLTTQSFASAWHWQHPGMHGGNGMLDTTVLTRTRVDWAPNNWKGECSGRSALGGDPVGTEVLQGFAIPRSNCYVNAILCTNSDQVNGMGWTVDKFNYNPNDQTFNLVTLDIYNRNDQRGSWQQVEDWAPNSYKGECPDGYAVSGLAQTPNLDDSELTKVLCGKISVPHPTSCRVVYNEHFSGQFSDWWGWSVGAWYGDSTYAGQDWNYGYYKASCWADTYVAGIAVWPAHHIPDALLCCQ